MDYKYFPHTEDDLQAMMEKVGVDSLDALYAQIPEAIRFRGDYQLPSGMSELEVRDLFEKLGSQNKQLTCFAGFGVYDHYMPSVHSQSVAALRVPDLLHTLSGRNLPGHLTLYL